MHTGAPDLEWTKWATRQLSSRAAAFVAIFGIIGCPAVGIAGMIVVWMVACRRTEQYAVHIPPACATVREMVYAVNPTTGALSSTALTTNHYFDHRGNLIAESAPGGLSGSTVVGPADASALSATTPSARRIDPRAIVVGLGPSLPATSTGAAPG